MPKNIYVGIPSDIPIYSIVQPGFSGSIDSSNFSEHFDYSQSVANSNRIDFEWEDTKFNCVLRMTSSTSAAGVVTATFVAKRDIGNVSFDYTWTRASTTATNYCILKVGNETVISSTTSSTSGSFSGSLTKGSSIYIQMGAEAVGTSGDLAKYANLYLTNIGVNIEDTKEITGYEEKEVARKVIEHYVGVDNVARRIIKGYVGVNNVARQFWPRSITPEDIEYFGALPPLSSARSNLTARTTPDGNHILFAGGLGGVFATSSTVVDAYNKSFTLIKPDSLSTGLGTPDSARVGNYVLIAGGSSLYNTSCKSTVCAYNNSLTRSNPTSLSVARGRPQSANVGGYALFIGGLSNSETYLSTADVYDASLTRRTVSTGVVGAHRGVCSLKNYALFAGGEFGDEGKETTTTAGAFTPSLTLVNAPSLKSSRSRIASATVGDFGVLAGGFGDSATNFVFKTTDVYDSSLTLHSAQGLSVARCNALGISSPHFAMINSGMSSAKLIDGDAEKLSCRFEAYDVNLTLHVIADLPYSRYLMAGDLFNNHAVWGGGESMTSYHSEVDAYRMP